MTRKKPQAKITATKRVFDGFFKMDEITVEAEKHNGGKQQLKRLIFERGHAVSVLAYDPHQDNVILINEMRPGMLAAGDNPFEDSLPAGMIDKGETALQAAKREMFEETGLKLKDARVIHSGAFVSPGGTSEKIALVFGVISSAKAGGVHGHVSEGEDIKTVVMKADQFIKRAEKGKVKDLKTLACAFWLAQNRDKIRWKYVPFQPPGIYSSL